MKYNLRARLLVDVAVCLCALMCLCVGLCTFASVCAFLFACVCIFTHSEYNEDQPEIRWALAQTSEQDLSANYPMIYRLLNATFRPASNHHLRRTQPIINQVHL